MKNSLILISTLILILFINCNSIDQTSPIDSFETTELLNGKIIDIKSDLINPFQILAIDDSIISLLEPFNSPSLKIYNLKERMLIADVAEKGKGPLEFNFPISLKRVENNKRSIELFDPNNKRTVVFNIDSLIKKTSLYKGKIGDEYKSLPNLFHYIKLKNGLIGSGVFSEGRFLMLDNNRINYFAEYPITRKHQKLNPETIALGYQGIIEKRQDEKKFVYVSLNAGLIEVFSIKDDKTIVKTAQRYDFYPFFKDVSANGGFGVAFHKKSPAGYQDVLATQDLIYTIFSGRTNEKHGSTTSLCEYLLIYNWEAKPIKCYKLDIPIRSFDIHNDILYGIAMTPEPRIVKYNLQ